MWGIAYAVEAVCLGAYMIYLDIDRNVRGDDYSDWRPDGQ